MSIFDGFVDLVRNAVGSVGNAVDDFIDGVNDIIKGNNGAEILNGAAGNDILRGGSGNDRFFAGDGNDQLFGERGDDQLIADAGNDTVNGGEGNDIVFGGNGNDILTGEAGRDELVGGEGNDFLSGGNGDDRLTGVDPSIPGLGFVFGEIDSFTGGGGRDTFVLGAGTQVFYNDLGNTDYALINDFNISRDLIELPANPEPVTATATEIGDAGQLLSNAQVIPGGTDFITGTISSNNDVDLFQITLGGGTFSATTVGGAAFDTQLFLFDENGLLVAQNDDSDSSLTLQSTLSVSPTSGSTIPVTTTGTTSLNPGTYFLAISSYDNDPVGSPLSDFTGDGFGNGSYTIALTGVQGNSFSLGSSPDGFPPGTAISFGNDLIAIVQGVSIPDFSRGFVFV